MRIYVYVRMLFLFVRNGIEIKYRMFFFSPEATLELALYICESVHS